jgi:hypothetical protein
VLVNISLDDRLCLDVNGVSTAVRLDAERKIGVWVDVPEETAKEPEAPVFVAECGISCSQSNVISILLVVTSDQYDPGDIPVRSTRQFSGSFVEMLPWKRTWAGVLEEGSAGS